ncbi:6,7-dimethyl-8-ribityllumazine synthase [Candidatus Liberibacter americanus]|uniref:6,7-dimethyl-8-ribityllumazine synthase n=1 Tax=Candidatus Liberibacter americanus str. Sao Paulo TaxID=1261131 RepID=U6B7K9_9HYPH|nr:6,7-dimethyl-8-ribityllumazine synthase [Candidatus Liberibacter americanus]AHA27702.1 Riboflavin synthase beta-chain [Candidatus Liberibacter americanus str. Sao Paulo]EMS36409.1 riboflavin synthase subunit beta [Candidatus Liberibacter americanus PW_SP]
MRGIVPHILVIEARFYEHLSCMLLKGCTSVLNSRGISWNSVITPGVLEIPAAVSMAIEAFKNKDNNIYNGIVVLGVVMRGETSHCDIIAQEATRGLMDIAIKHSFPIGNGIVVVDNEKQALDRASAYKLDRGGFAANSVLKMIELKASLSK